MQYTTEVYVCVYIICVYVCVSESGRAVAAKQVADGDRYRSPTRAGFHHDEVTFVSYLYLIVYQIIYPVIHSYLFLLRFLHAEFAPISV